MLDSRIFRFFLFFLPIVGPPFFSVHCTRTKFSAELASFFPKSILTVSHFLSGERFLWLVQFQIFFYYPKKRLIFPVF